MKKTIPLVDTHPFHGFYLDLDGVFADFEKRVAELAGRPIHQVVKKDLWKIVMADKDFFIKLEMVEDAHILWEYTKQYSPSFLTGAPPGERARSHKKEWVSKKFGEEWTTIVLPAKDKQLHSGPNKVLIDDNVKNISEWISKGGHGILHKTGDTWKTIDAIEELRKLY